MGKPNIENAYENIKSDIYLTRVLYCKELSTISSSEVYLKLDNQQLTGSFKLRGALNKLKVLLSDNPRIKKVVAASTGNHAAAIAYAAWKLNLDKIIFAPKSISKSKKENLEKQNIDLRLYGNQSVETEIYAKRFALEHNLPFIHPYNDLDVISGQGTIALELVQQIDRFDAVFVPVGGGGLISGIAYYLKTNFSHIKVIGCQPENASEMYDSLKSGKIVEPSKLKTISDGTAGGLDPDTLTFDFCKNYVDEIVLVSENEIAEALSRVYKNHHQKIEPAAALPVASILKHAKRLNTKKNVAIITGSKITTERLNAILSNVNKHD